MHRIISWIYPDLGEPSAKQNLRLTKTSRDREPKPESEAEAEPGPSRNFKIPEPESRAQFRLSEPWPNTESTQYNAEITPPPHPTNTPSIQQF